MVSLLQLPVLVCQFRLDTAQFGLKPCDAVGKLLCIAVVSCQFTLRCHNLRLLFGLFVSEILDHRRTTFDATLCQSDVRLQG